MNDNSRLSSRRATASARRGSASESQRKRVHRLASVGGLVALAGLESTPPDLLLGVLLESSERLAKAEDRHVEDIRRKGAARLRQRGAEKRAWTNHRRAAEVVHRLDLTSGEMVEAFCRLGIAPPRSRSAWSRALREALVRSDPSHLDRG